MSRPRTQRIGSLRRVPSYCFPARRQFPIRWALTLAVAIAWLLVLEGQESTVRFEPGRAVVVDTFEISLLGPELDATIGAARAAEPEPAPASVGDVEVAEAAAPPTRPAGAPTLEAAASSVHVGVPAPGRDADRRPAGVLVAAVPATGLRSPESPSSGDGLDLDAIAGSTGLASLAARLANEWPGARDTAPPSYDCLRLCGRGPPVVGVIS